MRELVEKTGLPAATLRFYEREGLLDERFIERGENNYRHYTEAAVERVGMIKLGQSAGFTLAEIKELMAAWDDGRLTTDEQISYLEQKHAELARKIEELAQISLYIRHKLTALHAKRILAEMDGG